MVREGKRGDGKPRAKLAQSQREYRYSLLHPTYPQFSSRSLVISFLFVGPTPVPEPAINLSDGATEFRRQLRFLAGVRIVVFIEILVEKGLFLPTEGSPDAKTSQETLGRGALAGYMEERTRKVVEGRRVEVAITTDNCVNYAWS